MRVTGKNGMGAYLKILLQIAFYGGIFVLISLPFVLQGFGLHLNASMIIIYPNGILLLIIIRQFIKLFDSLKNNQPFCENNVKILKSTGKVTLVGSSLWLFDMIYEMVLVKAYDIIFILAMIFLVVLFLGVSIALFLLAELFKEATQYKQENELTI